MDEVSPLARALLGLEVLQNRPGISAEALAAKLGVTDRAVRRYIRLLRDAGVPVESTTGRYGGYRLGRGLRLPPLTFSSAEALGLVMAVLDGHHDANDATDPVGSALAKIMRSLPEPVATQAEAVRRSTSPVPDRAAVRPDPATAATLVQACSSHRVVRLDYRSEAGTEWVTDVDPWAVVVRHGRWYLLCRSHTADAQRAYRIDRIRTVETLTDQFSPPVGVDPVAALENHLAAGWEYAVEVIIDAPFEVVAQCVPRTIGRLERIDAQTTRLLGSTSDPAWCVERLVGIPASYRIANGPELQRAARLAGERLRAAADGPDAS